MRNSRLLAAGALAGLLLAAGCQKPTTFQYSAMDNLPPKTSQRIGAGGLAIWALAAVDGKVEFYLMPPRNAVPGQLKVRLGSSTLEVEKRVEAGGVYFVWMADLGAEGVLKPRFDEPMTVEGTMPGGARQCVTIPGLGTDSYPVLNMCYFDIPWDARPCP